MLSAPKFSDLEGGKIRNMFMMVEDMTALYEKARQSYNSPDSDEEQKRWGFYTATAIQALLENHNMNTNGDYTGK